MSKIPKKVVVPGGRVIEWNGNHYAYQRVKVFEPGKRSGPFKLKDKYLGRVNPPKRRS